MNLINLNKINEKEKIIVVLMAAVLTVSGTIYLIILPALDDVQKLRADIFTQRVDLEKKIVREKNMSKLNEKFKKIEPVMEKFNQIFINQNRELEFITTLENVANQNQIAQKINLNPESGQSEQIYKKVPLELNVHGGFQNLIKYLINLEALNYYINIKSLEITAGKSIIRNTAEQPTNNINIKISADTYWK